MTTLAERLKLARSKAGLSQSKVAEAVGISQPTYQALESGKVQKTSYMMEIANALQVSPNWLATGQGEMPARENQINENNTQIMDFWDSETPLYDDEFEANFYKDAEFLGGSGFEVDVYDDGRRKIRYAYTAARRAGANPSKVICTTLVGDSMEELILDGSMIAIDTSKKDIREGKIYAFRHGNMLRVKYLIPRPDGGLIIRSHNERYTDEVITGEEIENENIQIIGWVWNWSSLMVW
ncbi:MULTISPECIES: helix-turn-helix transcriptional regulator [unclassified Moraxella]|uniref:XRE family transcriptional regulator n=1 Tax=unclassified Moraxella TaxID=2685852 RepID=UPI002B405F0A|nr:MULTISPECIES: helix-turn-helix transcriptional regulator [unclassified Moraxella]